MQTLETFLNHHLGVPAWVISIAIIALLTILVNQAAQFGLRQALRVTSKTKTIWDDALLRSARRPVLAALWIIGLGYMARVVQGQVSTLFLPHALAIRDVALIACVAKFALLLTGEVSNGVQERRREQGEELDPTTIDALGKLARLTAIILAILMAAQTLGFKIGGLLALGGVGGLAVGLAAKDLLANFFGGLTIYLDRPFSVGDWIRSPDKSIEGTVEYISWRHTRVRAFNKNPIYVPNAVFTSIVVENPSRMTHRRIKETIGVRYEDFAKVEPMVAEIRAMLQAHPGIDTSQTLIVNFNYFGSSSLDIMIYTFTKTTVWTEFHEVKQDVLLKIGEIIERLDGEIAFPTQTLHVSAAVATADAH
ncbi:MAG: mechanosensitive ion channel family protein [Kofleriaceae bacterium]